MSFQGGNELPKSSGPTDPCLSVHAGTGSPDMNEPTRPSASEESVTSRVRNAPQGSTHQHPHQAHEQQEPVETDKSAAMFQMAMEQMRMQTDTVMQLVRDQMEAQAERAREDAAGLQT